MRPAALPEQGRGVFLWTEAGENFPVSVTVARVSLCAVPYLAVSLKG